MQFELALFTQGESGLNKKYAVMIEGKNIYLNRGLPVRMGFFTTRWIEANSSQDAEAFALEHVKNELAILNVLCNSPDDPPDISIDQTREVNSFGDSITPEKGFSFYEDKLSTQ